MPARASDSGYRKWGRMNFLSFFKRQLLPRSVLAVTHWCYTVLNKTTTTTIRNIFLSVSSSHKKSNDPHFDSHYANIPDRLMKFHRIASSPRQPLRSFKHSIYSLLFAFCNWQSRVAIIARPSSQGTLSPSRQRGRPGSPWRATGYCRRLRLRTRRCILHLR